MKRELCDALQDSFFIIIPNPLKRRMSKNVNHFGDYWHFLKDKKHRYFSKFPLLCSADEIQVFNDMRVSEIIFHLCVNLSLYNISSQYEVQSCCFSSFFTNGMKMRWKVRKMFSVLNIYYKQIVLSNNNDILYNNLNYYIWLAGFMASSFSDLFSFSKGSNLTVSVTFTFIAPFISIMKVKDD